MVEDDHRHCRVCSKPIAPSEEVCSKACREKRSTQTAQRRQFTYLLYGLMAVVLLIFVLSYLHV